MYFSCSHAQFCEDLEGRSDSPGSSELIGGHYHHTGNEDNYVLYKAFVEAFTQRSITHAQDVMDAFAGISKILEHRFRSTLCFGIPQTALEFLMLWQRSGFLQRRTVQVDGATFPIFPSWSWASWIGKATYSMSFPFQNNRPRILWPEDGLWQGYRITPTEEGVNACPDLPRWRHWE